MPDTIHDVFLRTDWRLLSQQKLALIHAIGQPNSHLDRNLDGTQDLNRPDFLLSGLLNWIDALQDAARTAGLPVVWLYEDDIDDDEMTKPPPRIIERPA
jgi:hypothetical protein